MNELNSSEKRGVDMNKKLQYNEYGAPIQNIPKWCNLISWIFRKTGNLFYPKFKLVAVWFWVRAYAWGDLQSYVRIKGYKKWK